MKIGNILENIINGETINEERMNLSHINDTTILISRDNKLTLYDVNFLDGEEPMNGVIGFVSIGNEKGQLYVEIVGARKGFGPFMYELAMEFVYPNSLTPDIEGNTSESALRMWDYFYKGNNPDVELEPISKGDELYREHLHKYDIVNNPDVMKLFNCRYSLDGGSDYYYLESKTEDFFEEISGDENSISKKITLLGFDFFNTVY